MDVDSDTLGMDLDCNWEDFSSPMGPSFPSPGIAPIIIVAKYCLIENPSSLGPLVTFNANLSLSSSLILSLTHTLSLSLYLSLYLSLSLPLSLFLSLIHIIYPLLLFVGSPSLQEPEPLRALPVKEVVVAPSEAEERDDDDSITDTSSGNDHHHQNFKYIKNTIS